MCLIKVAWGYQGHRDRTTLWARDIDSYVLCFASSALLYMDCLLLHRLTVRVVYATSKIIVCNLLVLQKQFQVDKVSQIG